MASLCLVMQNLIEENDWEICFREAWSPEMTSQSFPLLRFCTPPEGKSLSKIFLCYTYQYIEEI